jgi:hypothetical protein
VTIALKYLHCLPSELGRRATSLEIAEIIAWSILEAEDYELATAKAEAQALMSNP